MFDETEVAVEGVTVPVKATATGKIGWWRYKAQEKEGDEIKIIKEGETIGVIDVKVNSRLETERVKAPSKGYIEKIIKEVGEDVTEGETIAEWKPVATVPMEILDKYGFSSIG